MTSPESTNAATPRVPPAPPARPAHLDPPKVGDFNKTELDQEVAAAMGGQSIEDIMAAAVSKGTPQQPTMDPNRPVRGGRPGARRERDPNEPNPDNIKRGKIASIRQGNVFVDLGGKSQGMCPLEQFDYTQEGEEIKGVEIGQEYEFVFKGYDVREGIVMLSRRGAIVHGAWETLRPGDVVEAQVTGVNKGGLELKLNTARAFMPAGQVDTKFNSDLSVFLNQRFTCIVQRVDRQDHNIILSRRAYLEQEEAKIADQIWGELAVGQVREGTVRSVQAYGAFINLGGIDGLLHVSAMSHTRVTDPKKVVKEGDKVQVMIIALDREKQRISLGLKQLTKDPWDDATTEFPVGTVITGQVKKIMDFGAFVELAPGVEGLVHISALATRRVNKVSEVVKEGDLVKAKVLNIDLEKKRISLSMAEAEREAKAAEAAEAAAAAGTPPEAAAAPGAAAPAGKPGKGKPVRKVPLKGGLF